MATAKSWHLLRLLEWIPECRIFCCIQTLVLNKTPWRLFHAREAMSGGVLPKHSHIPLWQREFEAKMDEVTFVHFEDHQLPAAIELKAQAVWTPPTCPRIPPKGAKFCQCGAPTSILDLKCQHPACGHPCHGIVGEMLNQDICYFSCAGNRCCTSCHRTCTPRQPKRTPSWLLQWATRRLPRRISAAYPKSTGLQRMRIALYGAPAQFYD